MRVRPFLSYSRHDERDVATLRNMLRVYGAGGWKDTEDLRLGASTPEELRRVIANETGGFVWWGTQEALSSAVINEIEIPSALARGDADAYPIVPVFVELDPKRNRRAILARIERGDEFLNRNGVVSRPRESRVSLHRRVSERYVADAIAGLATGRVDVSFRVFGEPAAGPAVTFDWRSIFDTRTRSFSHHGLREAIAALRNARNSLQRRDRAPRVRIDSDLPLPLAFLVGYEWRDTTRLRISVLQRTGSSTSVMALSGASYASSPCARTFHENRGPVVVAASCGSGMSGATDRYATKVGASEVRTFHLEGLRGVAELRGLAGAAASELRLLRDDRADKHLLILGPSALAFMIGAASNAVGPIVLPFWHNEAMGYVNPMTVGNGG